MQWLGREPIMRSRQRFVVVLVRCTVVSILAVGIAASITRQAESLTGDAHHAPEWVRMADGKLWNRRNLAVRIPGSFCYDDLDSNCGLFGRLYTWKAARQVCAKLGRRWRLPSDSDWRQMALHYGGIVSDASDRGASAYAALMIGGPSRFSAVLGGGREPDGRFERANAHGFYWSASRSDPGSAWFYNFGIGSRLLNRHSGETSSAFAVRCIKD